MKHSAIRTAGAVALALLLLLTLGACSTRPQESSTPAPASAAATEAPSAEQIDLGAGTLVSPEETALTLAEGAYDYQALRSALPKLTKLTGLTLPETNLSAAELDALRSAKPGLEVRYTLKVLGRTVDMDTEQLDVSGMTAEQIPELAAAFERLPKAVGVTFGDAGLKLSPEELRSLREALPGAEVYYELDVAGEIVGPRQTALDLSALTPAELPDVLNKLPYLPDLTDIELMDAAGSSKLATADVKAIMDAAPQAAVHYEFDLFGQRISTLDERVVYDSVVLSDSDEPTIRAALDILPNCTYFKLDEDKFGISNEIMASIREDYPDTKVVWRVWLGSLNMLTDEEILRITHMVTNENCGPLKYCNDAIYVDLGHNEQGQLTDTSYLNYMPKLECLILSGAAIPDIEFVKSCPNLVWLELGYCGAVKDLTPIASIPNLKYLNISGMFLVRDLSPLDDVKLERFMASECRIPYAEQQRFAQQHPDCLYAFDGFLYGYPWRYNAGPTALYNAFEYYQHMRELFCYYDGDKYWGNTKNSPYGDGYISVREGTSPEWKYWT